MFAILAAQLNGRPLSTYGQGLSQALLLSPTMFPVVFAANVGRCFKYIGLYRAEREGIALGVRLLPFPLLLLHLLTRDSDLSNWPEASLFFQHLNGYLP